MMKIYFTGAISAEKMMDNYRAIVKALESMGHAVISEHILGKNMHFIQSESQKEHEEYYKWMNRQLSSCDLMVAEVSFPSTVHVGHELTLALDKEKPVIALYSKGKQPLLFWGITSDKFFATEYSLEDVKEVLKDSIEFLSGQMDVRFNFFVSPRIVRFLDWVAKQKKMPRAVYLRRLIEEDMRKNKDFGKE